MTLPKLSPAEARRLIAEGAKLIDIRGADEHARARIPGARNHPIDSLGRLDGAEAIVYHCRSGMRTQGNSARLAAATSGPAYQLEGGLDAWRAAGLPLVENTGAPLEIMRQVQITAGSLVVLGVILGLAVHPGFFGLAAFVGAGLVFAGTSGWCGMAKLLAVLPWNRSAAA
jgi:rhodanese-related sulfurtransferase